MQTEDRLHRLVAQALARRHGGKPEARVERAALDALERDLEGGALRRRLGREQVVEAHPEDAGESLQFAELEFALAVLDDRDLRRRSTQFGGERVEGQPAVGAELPDATADGERIEHVFIVEVFCARTGHDSILTP